MQLRNLIIKFIVFSVIIAGVYFFAIWQLAQGQVDYFYSKFTHQAGSMVIGISRANDGIVPSVVEQNFGNDKIDYPVLNFAFTNQISDFGPVYLNAIKKKILPGTKNGLFIIEINPGSLSILKSQPDTESTILKDQSFLTKLRSFNKHPNFEYIREMYSHSLYKGFKKNRRIDVMRYCHADGWQEVMQKNEYYEVSDEEIAEWTEGKLNEFSKTKDLFKPSSARFKYLEETIRYLQGFGQVYLVRLPICSEFHENEQSAWPEFNSQIEEIAGKNQVNYLDYSMMGAQYLTYDGSHLFGHSAKAFTQKLCDDIKLLQNQSNQTEKQTDF